MGYLETILASIDNAKRVAGRNASDLMSDPVAYTERLVDRLRNSNANVVPTAASGELTNRLLTQDEIVSKYVDASTDTLSGGLGVIKPNNKIMTMADDISYGGEPITPSIRKELLSYFKDEGSHPDYRDMAPGAGDITRNGVPHGPMQVPAPKLDEVWYRGGPPNLRTDPPIFTTRDPLGAAWFASERGNDAGIGAINSYKIDAKNPARLRDMYETLLENPELDEIAPIANHVWDWLYDPRMRDALRAKKFDSGLGLDPLERDEIETLIALDPKQLQPVERRLITGENNPIIKRLGDKAKPLAPHSYYMQLGIAKKLRQH